MKNIIFVIAIFSLFLFSCKESRLSRENEASFLSEAYAKADSSLALQQSADNMIYNSRQNAITRAVAKVSPAVVGINVVQVRRIVRSPFSTDDPFWRAVLPELFRSRVYEEPVRSLGSGFVISPDGYLVTNQHVVEDAREIVITMTDGKQYSASLVGYDRRTDIALLKIEADNLPYIEMGSSGDLIVGEWVIALGNPFGLFQLNDKPTVTVGVISAVDRDWGTVEETGRLYMDMIQTDAAINTGNSGGPLVNSLGQVIGMNTFIYTGSSYQEGFVGIGFAIPIDRIKEVVEQLKVRGSINRHYWLGILSVQDLNPYISRALGLQIDKGVIIAQIEPGSPADQHGLREEDVILEMNGQKIQGAQELVNTLKNMDLRVGDVLTFKILRQNRTLLINVKLEELPE